MKTVKVMLYYQQMVPCKRVCGFFNCSPAEMQEQDMKDLVKAGFATKRPRNDNKEYQYDIQISLINGEAK